MHAAGQLIRQNNGRGIHVVDGAGSGDAYPFQLGGEVAGFVRSIGSVNLNAIPVVFTQRLQGLEMFQCQDRCRDD